MKKNKFRGIFNKISFFKDRKFKEPRVWSNQELKKFGFIFQGDIVNISGWKDMDKEGNRYKEYFKNAKSYQISNYNTQKNGFQGDMENEFFLDLAAEDINQELIGKYDVVFNHTTLEHIFKVEKASQNLCLMSKDIVIVIVPFLQEQHAEYGDYWRFTPLTIKKIFEENNMETLYLNYNDNKKDSIYIFAIGSKKPKKWLKIKQMKGNRVKSKKMIGQKVIKNSLIKKLWFYFKS